jgi:hypothetical protein
MPTALVGVRLERHEMAGRSYLRRIARPVVPGDPQLTPIAVPLAQEARPPAVQSAHTYKALRATDAAVQQAPVRDPVTAAPAEADAPHPSAVTDAPPARLNSNPEAPAPQASVVPARSPVARPHIERGSPMRFAPAPAVDRDGVIGVAPLPEAIPKISRATEAIARANVHIGTIEVRTQPAPRVSSPAPAQPPRAASPRAAPAIPPSPLSRGLAWRYGLVQG